MDSAAGRGPAPTADDATEVTATQLRDVVGRIIDAGHWCEGGPSMLLVADAGYDLPIAGLFETMLDQTIADVQAADGTESYRNWASVVSRYSFCLLEA